MKPFVRWVGGKRRMLDEIMSIALGPGRLLPTRYYEPFVGGGAALLAFGSATAYSMIADVNVTLMDAYLMVKRCPDDLISDIKSLDAEPYEHIKHEFNECQVTTSRRAALFLALNHLCFNGLYRVNKSGKFNTPIGKHGSTLKGTNRPRTMSDFPYEAIQQAHLRLQNTAIRRGSFVKTMADIEIVPGRTIIFCDPPYLGEYSSYDKSGFLSTDHAELAMHADYWRNQGALVIVCGSNNKASHEIYGEPTRVINLKRTVGASNRGDATEALYVFSPEIRTVLKPAGHTYVEGRVNPKAAGFIKL